MIGKALKLPVGRGLKDGCFVQLGVDDYNWDIGTC